MTVDRLLTLLHHPSLIQREEVFEMEDMITQYPFFQAIRAIHLKGLKTQNSFRYNQSLKTTAIYTADRSVLFSYITATEFNDPQNKKSEEEIINDIEMIDVRVIEGLTTQHSVTNDDLLSEHDEEINSKLSELYNLHQIVSPEQNNITEQAPTFQTPENKEINIDKIELSKEIDEQNTIISEQQQDLHNPSIDKIEQTKEDNNEGTILSKNDTTQYENFDNLLQNSYQEHIHSKLEDNNEKQTRSVENQLNIESDSSQNTPSNEIVFELIPDEIFTETILEQINQQESSSEKIPLTPNIQLDKDYSTPINFHKEDTFSFTQWLSLSQFKPIDRSENKLPKEQKMELIDKFIVNNPKIEPINKESELSPEKSVQITENEEIMTETLARVYVLQNKYNEAIQAYEILSLKFPEKITYFATQIKQIEILKKNR